MDKIIVKARAKVNISLDVLGTRVDGYHEMQMVNHSIELHDTLTFESCDEKINLTSNSKRIPLDEKNLVIKAMKKLQNYAGINKGIKIYLDKRIPYKAGLAGGSSDAAATLKGLNRLWHLDLTPQELLEIGATIGADVPYCLMGGTALVTGIGEKLIPLPPMKKLYVVVIKPNVNISTPWAFRALDHHVIQRRPDITGVIRSLEAEDYTELRQAMGNVFEPLVVAKFTEVNDIKQGLLDHGAAAAIMTGSGPTVIGYFPKKAEARNIWKLFSQKYKMCFLSETC